MFSIVTWYDRQETVLNGLGLVVEEIGFHRDPDVACDLFVKVFAHARGSTVTSVFTESGT